MSRIPDFSNIGFAGAPAPSLIASDAEPWLTPEGIPVKAAYSREDRAGLDFLDTYPGLPPYVRGPYPTMYVNQPWTIPQHAGSSTPEGSTAPRRRPPRPR